MYIVIKQIIFVGTIAGRRFGEDWELIMLKKDVRSAETHILQTNTNTPLTVNAVGIASIRKVGKADVYNMEVEHNHNFAVNGGYIVHNCMDDIRYFCNTILKNRCKEIVPIRW